MKFPIAQKLRRVAAAVSLLLLAFTLLPTALAQETTGAIQGTITDPTGAVVAGATVVATGDKLIKPAIATTDSHGFYRLNALPPGNYTLNVSGSGMKAKATDLASEDWRTWLVTAEVEAAAGDIAGARRDLAHANAISPRHLPVVIRP